MSVVEDLEKLKKLKDIGAITETEFEIEKQKILTVNLAKNENNTDKKATKATVGMILGLVSIIAWYIPFIGFPVTVLGIIFSGLGMNSINKNKAIVFDHDTLIAYNKRYNELTNKITENV